jgi:hypothetical protein
MFIDQGTDLHQERHVIRTSTVQKLGPLGGLLTQCSLK